MKHFRLLLLLFVSGLLAGVGPLSLQDPVLVERFGQARPDFYWDLTDGSDGSLPDSLTVNGTLMNMAIACDGDGFSGTTWTCRSGASFTTTLSEGYTGDSPASTTNIPFTSASARAVSFGGVPRGKELVAPSAAAADIGTSDFAFEVVFRATHDGAGADYLLSKRDGSSFTGWAFGVTATGLLVVVDGVSGAGQLISTTVTIVPNSWYHVFCYVNRNQNDTNGGACSVNGVQGSGANLSTASTSVGNNTPLSVGGWGPGIGLGGDNVEGAIARVTIWDCSACWASGAAGRTEAATIASERFTRLIETYADVATGSPLPTTATRASAAYVDIDRDGERRLSSVGSGWLRTARRADQNGTMHTGYLVEPLSANLFLRSQELENVTWTASQITAVANAALAPDGTLTAEALQGTGGVTSHYIRPAVNVGAAAIHTASAFVKSGDLTWAAIANGTAGGFAYFDLTSCEVGTRDAQWSASSAESYTDGWCRISATRTLAGQEEIRLYPVIADATPTYNGTGLNDLYVWGQQFEAQPNATSYIPTTTVSASRAADDLRFNATGNASVALGTFDVEILLPSFDQNTSNYLGWIGASGASTDYIYLLALTTDAWNSEIANAAVPQAAWTSVGLDPSDGLPHSARVLWTADDARFYVDGRQVGATDTTVTVPASFSNIFIGESRLGTGQLSGIIKRVRIWDTLVLPL